MAFDLESFLPYRLFQAADRSSRRFFDAYGDRFDLGRTDWRVMFNIGQFGPLTAAAICQRSGLEKTKVSRAIVRLENRGWLLRHGVDGDRRRQDIALTPEGEVAFFELREMAEQFNLWLETVIGAEAVPVLLSQLRKIEGAEPANALDPVAPFFLPQENDDSASH